MKVYEQDSEDIFMISKIKKGVAWEGIVIKIFWATELNDPMLDIRSFKLRWFFKTRAIFLEDPNFVLFWVLFVALSLVLSIAKGVPLDIMPGIPLFLHQSNLQASTLNFQQMQRETSIFLVFGRTTSAGKQDLPQVTILLQLHETFWFLLRSSSKQIRRKI